MLFCATAGQSTNEQSLLSQATLDDLSAVGIDDKVIRSDRAGDNRFTQAGVGIDNGLMTPTGERIGGKEDTCDGCVDHALNHDGQAYGASIDTVARSIADGPVVPQRGPAASYGIEQGIEGDNVQNGILLSGETGEREIFGSGRGAYSYG